MIIYYNENENINEDIINNENEINIKSQRKKSANEEYDDLKHKQKLDESSMIIENHDQEKVVEPLITDEESEKKLEFKKKITNEDKMFKFGNKEEEGQIKRITKKSRIKCGD